MRPDIFHSVEAPATPDGLPFRVAEDAANGPHLIHLIGISVLAAAVVLPQIGLAAYALVCPELRAAIIAQPGVSLQVALAIAVWIGIFAWPLRALRARLTERRTIEISAESVAIAGGVRFASGSWSAPLSSYKGVAHHIRSSLAGTRHELVLIHPDPKRSVLLMVADHLGDNDVNRMTHLLRLPEVSAKELYRLGKDRDTAREPMVWTAVPA